MQRCCWLALLAVPSLAWANASQDVRVSDFGFDATDSTRFLQAAIRSGAKRVVVDKQASAWITEPLFAVSDQEIHFEPGVEVLAKKGAFHGKNDTLLTLENVHDVRLTGPSAVLRMHHDDYMSAAYSKAEWRNVINILSCERVTIEGLTLKDSGGDGIYVGCSGRAGPPCRDIVVRHVVSDGNARQGSSIITVDGLLYEDCVFSNTHGRPPQDGIDIEPNKGDEVVRNCVFRRCRFENNRAYGFNLTYPGKKGDRAPGSVRLEDCTFVGNLLGFCYGQGKRHPYFVDGSFVVTNCVFEGMRGSAVNISRKIGDTMRAEIVDCRIKDCCQDKALMGDIRIDSLFGDLKPPSAITLRNIEIVQSTPHEEILFTDMPYGAFERIDISGNLSVKTSDGVKKVNLDRKFVDRELPGFWNDGEPRRRPLADKVGMITDAKPGQMVPLSPLMFKGSARYVFAVEAAQTVRFVARGGFRKDAELKPAIVVRPFLGAASAEVGSFDEKGGFGVCVSAAGLYVLTVESPKAVFGLTRSSAPIAFDLSQGPVSLRASSGKLFIPVQKGQSFNVMVSGSSYAERVGAVLQDPSGREVWSEKTIASWRGCRVRKDVAEGLWQLSVCRPEKGHFEDYWVDATGIEPLLFLSSEKYWR